MTPIQPVYLNIHWHQHQPWYVQPGTREAVLPWVRLHGIKDYYDIAWLCQRYEEWKQTINLVPALLEQIQMYVDGSLTDRALELSRKPAADLNSEEKTEILSRFFDAHAPRMIHPYPRYDELFRKRGASAAAALQRYTVEDFRDLQVWFNLTWVDPLWREDPGLPLAGLIKKQRGFTEEEKQQVLDVQREILAKIIPLHCQLHQQGNLELTCSPYFHPILPLLCDNAAAKVSNPMDPVPEPPFAFPEDAEWHIQEGIKAFEQIMGCRPAGMWPSEGSVSDEACGLMAKAGMPFFAADEGILFRSRFIQAGKEPGRDELYRLHRLQTAHGEIDCVFRDHGLSDLIGFTYQRWDAQEAATDFIAHLKAIGQNWTREMPPLVSVILDGENCWEYYPRDGHDFQRYLIEGILNDPQIQPVTVPEYRALYPPEPTLRSIFPGSWINSNFRIWIGHQEDNAAWHFLRQAREVLLEKQNGLDGEARRDAWRLLHIAEGSDWFWWYGDENVSTQEMLFDSLFRNHLIHLYARLGLPAPEGLKRPIKQPRRVLKGGGILFHAPIAMGRAKGYYPWVGAQLVSSNSGGAAMRQAKDVEADLLYGRLNKSLVFHVEFKDGTRLDEHSRVSLQITKPVMITIPVNPPRGADTARIQNARLEGVVDLEAAGIAPTQEAWFYLEFESKDRSAFSIPGGSEVYLPGFTAANSSLYWFM